MDANKLRTEVFEKTGIKVDTTDPVFALVALNEAVLADYAQQNLAGLHDAVDKLREQTKSLLEAGERAKSLLLQMGHKVDDPAPPMPSARKTPPLPVPLLALAGGTALLAALTPEQQQAMQNGEKFAKAWPKLDAKTQAKLQALMQ